jgi:gliding motility-associated-like protein
MIPFSYRFFSLLSIIFPVLLGAQSLSFPIHTYNGQNIMTGTGTFTDSGGPDGNYLTAENYAVTFTAPDDKDYISLRFTSFELATGDYIYIHDGSDATSPQVTSATGNQLLNKTFRSSGASLHIRFQSTSGTPASGWVAQLAALRLCDLFYTTITTPTGNFDFCPDITSATFTGNAGYAGQTPPQPPSLVWQWNFDGNLQSGPTATTVFDGPGAYPFRVSVNDVANNCAFDTIITVRLATVPVFNGTISSQDTLCASEPVILTGVVVPQRWTGFPTSVESTQFITLNQPYLSSLDFNVFPAGSTITTMDDFDRVCIHAEHTDFGHLSFELECPNGTFVMLKDFGPGGAALGEPVIFGNPDIPGRSYEYCFKNSPQFGTMNETAFRFHSYLDMAGDYYHSEPYLPAGSYTPDESFQNLAGCPLNGDWSVRVSDRISGSSGHIMGWSLYFDNKFYPDSLQFIPEVVEQKWFDQTGREVDSGKNPASVTLSTAGEYFFTFRATDDFGCRWDTTLTVRILPLPLADIVSEPELPVCEGDTAIFRVVPRNLGDNANWVYQWMLRGAELPGRTSDTIHAWMPVTYTVRITDTVTGCISFNELAFSDQNCELRVPNVFTPNGDGINDQFVIENLEHYPNSVMVIYNRNGKKVFEHNDYYLNWWDGGNQSQGTYYYVLTYTRFNTKRQTQGIITIIK